MWIKCVQKQIENLMISLRFEAFCVQEREEYFLSSLLNHISNTVLWLGCFVVEKAIIKSIGYMKDL